MATIRGELLTVAEVRDFRDQLRRLHGTAKGSVKLIAYKNALELRIEASGGGELEGEVVVTNPMYHNSLRAEIRVRSELLPGAIAGLDQVLATFPELGESP